MSKYPFPQRYVTASGIPDDHGKPLAYPPNFSDIEKEAANIAYDKLYETMFPEETNKAVENISDRNIPELLETYLKSLGLKIVPV